MTVLDLQNQNRQLYKDELQTVSVSACLGFFDGVHIGHAALLKTACETADRLGAAPAVWTFSAPPFPGRAKQLTTLSQKLALFASHGIRYAFLYDFDDVRAYEPSDFVNEILIGACHAKSCVCGFNFRFGHDAGGTPDFLQRLLLENNAELQVLPAVTLDGTPVSATRIRSLLACGDTAAAARCLGRYYEINLPVVHGKALGRTIGVPTVNQNPPQDMQLPADGTYATSAYIDGVAYPAVTNIGIRPSVTHDDHRPNIETHIIGYSGWLYDRGVTIAFRHRLREEMHFDSLDALKGQIADDIRASSASFTESFHKRSCP